MNELEIHSRIVQARELAAAGKMLHAVQHLESVVREEPTSEAGWWELAHIYIDQRRFEIAEKAIRRALAHVREKESFDFLLAKLYFASGEKGKAYAALNRLDKNPNSLSMLLRAEVAYFLGVIERDRHRAPSAEMYFARVRSMHPQFPRINEHIAELQFERGALTDALTSLKTAIDIDPTSWAAFYLFGLVRLSEGAYDAALKDFETAVDLNPDEATLWEKCGEASMMLERVEEAERYLRKALKMDETSLEALVTFSRLLIKKGSISDARAFIDRAVAIAPADKEVRRLRRELETIERRNPR